MERTNIPWLAARPRYQVHFTPTSSSGLNQIEPWFAEITRKRIRRGTFSSVHDLTRAIHVYIRIYNKNPGRLDQLIAYMRSKPGVWFATGSEISQYLKNTQQKH
jgi:hypothetical protein